MDLVRRIIAGSAGVVFIVTGALKLVGAETFRFAVGEHGLVPEGIIGPFALGFALVELALGAAALVLAVFGRPRVGLWIGASLFGLLALYSAAVALRPPDGPVPCGCGFGSMVENWWALALRNVVLAAAIGASASWDKLGGRVNDVGSHPAKGVEDRCEDQVRHDDRDD